MLASGKAIVLPVILSAVLASSAVAQASCEVEEGRPTQVARGLLSVTQAANAQATENWTESANSLRTAVRLLNERAAVGANEIGRSFVLGKALALWLNMPDQPTVTAPAAVGLPDAAGATVDLVAAVDSLFDIVEQAHPECAEVTAEYRRQRTWIGMLNGSIDHLNAGRVDSAEAVARRSLVLSESPYAYMVLGHVANNRGNRADALRYYRQTVDAATDTLYRDVREQTLLAIGNLAANAAEDTSATARAELTRQATEAFNELITSAPNSAHAPAARAGLSRALLLQGDTTAFRSSFQAQLENPGRYTFHELITAAVAAARASQWREGVALFEGALQQNPWSRDALYNAALGHHELGNFQQMIPHIRRLVQVDPSNGENWRLFAFAYNGLAKATRNSATQRAMNDSVVKYYEMAESMPHQVQFTEFSTGGTRTTLAGTIQNLGTAAKDYTMRVEFLDKDGNVVGSSEAQVAGVAPQASGRFSVSVENAPNAIAFRYAPLT